MIASVSTANALESIPSIDPALGLTGVSTGQHNDQPGQHGQRSQRQMQATPADVTQLSPEAQRVVSKLQQRDREVRSHEQAHISAGGSHVSGGASYTYTRGPDGKQYATGGSVNIDTSSVPNDPEATLEKARMIRSAALAPGSPSAQDQSVAAQASSMEMKARTEKAAAIYQNMQDSANPSSTLAPWGTGIAFVV